MVGAWVYGIGAALGRDRIRAIAARLPLVKLSDVDRTEAWFLKHGVKAVFFGRIIRSSAASSRSRRGWNGCRSGVPALTTPVA